jgi:AAA+ ATPase superfamily predicted ATPase
MLRPKCSQSRWGSSALRGTIIIEQRPAIVGLCFTRKFTYRNFTSKNHHQSLWLYSPRRYGKTSLVLEAFSQITDIQTIYIDLFGSVNEQEFLHSYLDTLSRKLLSWQSGMKTITSVLRSIFRSATPSVTFDMKGNPSISLNVDPATNTQAAKEILNFPESISYRKPICIVLDDFQEIATLNPKLINVSAQCFSIKPMFFTFFWGAKTVS